MDTTIIEFAFACLWFIAQCAMFLAIMVAGCTVISWLFTLTFSVIDYIGDRIFPPGKW